MRWPRRVAALLALLLLLAGPPLLLVRVVGWPIRGVPTAEQFQDWVAQPLTEGTLRVGLTLLAWQIWLFVAYTAVVAAAQRVRSGARWLRRLPLPTPLQATATGVAGAAVFGTGHASLPAPPDPATAVTATTLDRPTGGDALDAAAAVDVGEGVTVPGGWLPRGTAEQAAAASVLVWLRRRRDYRPLMPGPQQDDLTPLPPTVAAVRAAVDVPQAPETDAHSQPAQDRPLTVLPQAVALSGPGALHAGRGVLVTTLLTALRQPTGATPVVITRTALTMLLGAATAAALRQGPTGLRVTASLDEALAAADGVRHQMLLITEAVSASTAPRLAAALHDPTVTAVVLGSSPIGAEWHVDVNGHSRDAGRPQQDRPRLCVLDQVAANDLLTILTHAPPPPARPPADTTAVPRPRPPADPVTAHPTTATPSPAELRVLGKPRLLVDGQHVAIRRSAAWQALILLAVHPDGLRTRQLTAAIWPGVPAHTVTGRLYTTISELRRTAGAGATVIAHADDRYRLDPDQLDVDLWHLRAAARRAAAALTDQATAWQAVIDTYTGDLATGHTWAWIDQPRETARRLVIDAYAAAAGAQSDPHRALELLEAALRVDPYNAHLHRRAADALTAVGDHAGAAELRHTYTERLARAGLSPELLDQAVATGR